jgi:hypothetical protein
MYLVVDSDWAKAHPRRAAKIQVANLLWLARRRDQASVSEANAHRKATSPLRHKVLVESPLGS